MNLDNQSLYSEAITLNESGPVGVKKIGGVFVAFAGDVSVKAPTLAAAVEDLAKKVHDEMTGSFH